MSVVYKSNKAKIGDGLRITRVSDGGQKLEVLTDAKAGTYSEVILLADGVAPPPPPPPIDPPPPGPVLPPVTTGDTAALIAALMAAKGGEVISLKPGFYGDFAIAGKQYASPVRIVSEDTLRPATFGRIAVTGVGNLTFDSIALDWRVTAETQDHHAGFDAMNASAQLQ